MYYLTWNGWYSPIEEFGRELAGEYITNGLCEDVKVINKELDHYTKDRNYFAHVKWIKIYKEEDRTVPIHIFTYGDKNSEYFTEPANYSFSEKPTIEI